MTSQDVGPQFAGEFTGTGCERPYPIATSAGSNDAASG
jgi:hypothetical protein